MEKEGGPRFCGVCVVALARPSSPARGSDALAATLTKSKFTGASVARCIAANPLQIGQFVCGFRGCGLFALVEAWQGGSDDLARVELGVVAWDTVCQGTSTA
jgi:hypothetical protein